ncbi:hypothetical protein A2480_04370 [Candidatus Uhrbacteria bacterium RIFOXYC2_FULL_47_19]|uniref:Uncharacterized protein n=1 Tax=Candidatus Uhrbacteria bacterium RIFOXYC2_FULL_47_19 TaxID=1802424 RepID=A0A1F7WF93_9BACT|nr:MAG: hypothetical protein A2480_04370 [Candidatus Uhrbacteria bacterium RIFOXYC2_FULL_47_19]HCC21960.1 hypothetical protein [Candidatus Uhrbacteria bacterium]
MITPKRILILVVSLIALVILLAVGYQYALTSEISGLNGRGGWKCALRGGEMIDTGRCGVSGCVEKCEVILPDEGQTCRTSDDCEGWCLLAAPERLELRSSPFPLQDLVAPRGCLPINEYSSKEYACDYELVGSCSRHKSLGSCMFAFELLEGNQLKEIGSCGN